MIPIYRSRSAIPNVDAIKLYIQKLQSMRIEQTRITGAYDEPLVIFDDCFLPYTQVALTAFAYR